jgi:hypothetical protein
LRVKLKRKETLTKEKNQKNENKKKYKNFYKRVKKINK